MRKLNEVVTTDIPQTEEAYGTVQGAVASSRQPTPDSVFEVQKKLTALLVKLRDIRGGIGAGLDLKKAIEQLENIIKISRFTLQSIRDAIEAEVRLVRFINVRVPQSPATVEAERELTVRIPVVIGALYNGKFTLKLEPSAGSGLTVLDSMSKPIDSIKLKDDDTEITIKIKAGATKGTHNVRITPDEGPVRELKVIVR